MQFVGQPIRKRTGSSPLDHVFKPTNRFGFHQKHFGKYWVNFGDGYWNNTGTDS